MAKEAEIIKLYKEVGETPLECIERFRAEHPEYKGVSMTYLGRLDPMAEGLLLVLAGDTRSKAEYLDLGKTYEFEVLWGFETDTYDILGLVTKVGEMPTYHFDTKLPGILKKIKEKKTQVYPPYSSRTVGGKSLHEWAREGRISEVTIPERGIKIFSIEHMETRLTTKSEILSQILNRIGLVSGDFRQSAIVGRWREVLQSDEQVLISKFKASVSSGTYIRSIAHEMGGILGCGGLAFSIKRTRVGDFSLS